MLKEVAYSLALAGGLLVSEEVAGRMKEIRPKDCKPGYGRTVKGFLDLNDKSTKRTACLGIDFETVEDKRRECAERALELIIHDFDEKHWCCGKRTK